MWCEDVRESADILDLKLDCVVPGFMNLCNLFSVVWFLVVGKPLVETLKQSKEQMYSVMSEVKWAYLVLLFYMSIFNMLISWASQFKQMNGFSVLVQFNGDNLTQSPYLVNS